MDSVPPPNNYAQYPRPNSNVDVARLRDLSSGYHGLSLVFVLNIVMSIVSNIVVAPMSNELNFLPKLGAMVFIFTVVFAALTYPHNKKIGSAKGWAPSGAMVASLLMGLTSALCCGIIGYVVMQQFASSELKKAGVNLGMFVTKKKIDEQIDQIAASSV